MAAAQWASNGYFRINGFLSIDDCRRLIHAAEHIVHEDQRAIVRYEQNLSATIPADQRVSKLYRFHRTEPFRSLATSPRLISLVRPLIGSDVDIFLSQVVWKVAGALGQPWHAWIALTEASEANSCLRVVPRSHNDSVASHGRDQSSIGVGRYVTLVDQDVVGYRSLSMSPGDLVVFDSHLVHSSGDNLSEQTRIALCFHFAEAGTVDRTAEVFGQSPYNDWMPACRTSG
jgi:ectoine hydroxylase-related dioxygenase (phytanoyl-CoA dioxygenase family)